MRISSCSALIVLLSSLIVFSKPFIILIIIWIRPSFDCGMFDCDDLRSHIMESSSFVRFKVGFFWGGFGSPSPMSGGRLWGILGG
ncbi:hypothetical protein DFH28DRAFT_1004881 [Melampsora americana]|nr:hypothetical protein DFH28DRAFT_1004881 [Melampsora americana]